jgi:lysozyme family protein
MKTVREIAEEIVAREGGYVNDPADPGGATNYGVTIGTMRALRRDINGDGQVDVADVRGLSRAEAVDIFVRHYFERPGIAALPPEVQPSLFDMYVNAGANAVKVLQRMLTARGYACVADGQIGPGTIAAAATMATLSPGQLANAYGVARRDYYYALGDARPASRKYARRRDGGKGGWITRAEAFLPQSLWLTDAQHHARTATWN